MRRGLFSSCGEQGLLFRGAWASHRGGSSRGAQALVPTDLSTAAPGLESPGPVAVMHGLSCSAACGLPRPGVKSSGASSERLPLPQSCLTLCPPGSSVHRISQARLLEWVAISFSRFLLFLLVYGLTTPRWTNPNVCQLYSYTKPLKTLLTKQS